MPKTKKRPLNMERNGSIFKADHFIPALTLCHQMEPAAIKQGKRYSDTTLRTVYAVVTTLYPTSTKLPSFRNYMNAGATDDECKPRWKEQYVKTGQLNKVRTFMKKVH